MTEKLKPCPCGGIPEIHEEWRPDGYDEKESVDFIHCPNCHAEINSQASNDIYADWAKLTRPSPWRTDMENAPREWLPISKLSVAREICLAIQHADGTCQEIKPRVFFDPKEFWQYVENGRVEPISEHGNYATFFREPFDAPPLLSEMPLTLAEEE